MSERRPRGPATFRPRELTAAIKAALNSGAERFRVEVERGKLTVVVEPKEATLPPETARGNEWDGEDEAL